MNDALGRLRDAFEAVWSEYVASTGKNLLAAGLPSEISSDTTEFLERRGKRIRPLLFLLVWQKFSGVRLGEEIPRSILEAALGLELLHAFVLVHDDVIDRSATRRGRPTLHKMFDAHLPEHEGREHDAQSLAVVLGDVLFSDALSNISRASYSSRYHRMIIGHFLSVVRDTGLGEMRDVQMASAPLENFTEADVRQMYWLKTTRYTVELPLVLGYLMAGGDEANVETLGRYAELLGLAFQILNDLADLEESPSEKSGDILDAKKTWLLVRMNELLDEADRAFFRLCLSEHPRDGRFVHKIRMLLDKSCVCEEARQLVESLLAEATRVLADSQMLTLHKEKIFL